MVGQGSHHRKQWRPRQCKQWFKNYPLRKMY